MGKTEETENSMSNDQLKKAKKNRRDKEREMSRDKAFKTYEQYPGDMLQTDKRVLDNIDIAKNLEYRANNTNFMGKEREKNFSIGGKDLGFNLMDTSLVAKGLDAVQKSNYLNQAGKLRAGGKAVFGDKGSYQGVVSKNSFGNSVYSGNADYSPIGRSEGASYNTETGTYTSTKMDSTAGNDSEAMNNTPDKTKVKAINKTDSTTSLSSSSRRSLIAGSGGGATRRNLI